MGRFRPMDVKGLRLKAGCLSYAVGKQPSPCGYGSQCKSIRSGVT